MDELLKSVHYTGSTCFSILYSNITLFFSLFPFLMTFEIENIGQINNRLHALRSINKELLENQTRLDKERESTKLVLIQYLNKQRTVLLHCNNQLHQQQTQLDSIRLEAYKWVNTHTHTHTAYRPMSSVQLCLPWLQTIHMLYRNYNWSISIPPQQKRHSNLLS